MRGEVVGHAASAAYCELAIDAAGAIHVDEWLRGPGVARYLARIDGHAVATADLTLLQDERAVFLGGAMTLPERARLAIYTAYLNARYGRKRVAEAKAVRRRYIERIRGDKP